MKETSVARMAGFAGLLWILVPVAADAQLVADPDFPSGGLAPPPERIAAFFVDKRPQILAAALLFAIAYLLLLTFGAGIWQVLRRAGDTSALPPLVLGASVWVTALGSIGITASAAAAFRAPELEASTGQLLVLFDMNNTAFALVEAPFAIFFASASLSAMSTRAFPQWVNGLGIVAAILNLPTLVYALLRGEIPPGGLFAGALGWTFLDFLPVIPIWVWTIAVGVVMIRGRKPAPASA